MKKNCVAESLHGYLLNGYLTPHALARHTHPLTRHATYPSHAQTIFTQHDEVPHRQCIPPTCHTCSR